ncbi:SET domain-containing protein 5 [Curvularia kusanoi]|uniref:SET domain-containing protein 5 n=1 Tax=Curvularia kusanoi TaxID=90978 RepID=A0A9P4W9R5_CURKU|nr:SET domain-containing protein 5 [Curvularia kusanoi]
MTSLVPLYILIAYSIVVMVFNMKGAVNFGLFSGAYALNQNKLNQIPQQALLQDACPSDSILRDGECHLATTAPSEVTFKSNITTTLDEARLTASQQPNFPWTFWPECFSNEETPDPYCLFSDQSFANGRGIFIVTTEPLAYGMLQKQAFKNPESLDRSNHHANPPFVEHDFPIKGRGLVANKTLFRGDQIFASTPLLIADPDAYKLAESERIDLLYRGVSTLPKASQDLFWGLLGHFKGDAVDDRINTNNFEVFIDNISQAALFPEIAMLNHDCRPNAAYFFDEETLTHYVHAMRTIQPGEEITISYIDSEKTRAHRMRRLERNWGFKCDCSACTAHPALTAESDARLDQIQQLLEKLNDWSEESTASPEMAEALVSLYDQERLWAYQATAYKHAAEAYSAVGNRFMAIKYARLSAEFSILDKGFSDGDVKEMKKMASAPEKTWSWNKRVGIKKGGCGCGKAH